MKPGDKLKFLDHNSVGTLLEVIDDEYLLIEDQNGFVLKVEKGTMVAEDYLLTQNMQLDLPTKQLVKKSKSLTIDIHIEKIYKDVASLNPWEIPLKQLLFFKQHLDKAIEEEFTTLTVIHGKGNGILKQKLITTTKKYDSITWESEDENGRFNEGVTTFFVH